MKDVVRDDKTAEFEEVSSTSKVPTIASAAIALPTPAFEPHALSIDLATS